MMLTKLTINSNSFKMGCMINASGKNTQTLRMPETDHEHTMRRSFSIGWMMTVRGNTTIAIITFRRRITTMPKIKTSDRIKRKATMSEDNKIV